MSWLQTAMLSISSMPGTVTILTFSMSTTVFEMGGNAFPFRALVATLGVNNCAIKVETLP
ncbi:hypothetical protein AFK24_15495 [Pseudomonas syringae]|uniref:Uncharacterized protein n=1 Tax=Pseudomonas syringae TaxID=317 RepID=A0A1C7Z2K1_PSESX|nr:hypothetical protein AFK24_15495 [Pseudomonas syringae]